MLNNNFKKNIINMKNIEYRICDFNRKKFL